MRQFLIFEGLTIFSLHFHVYSFFGIIPVLVGGVKAEVQKRDVPVIDTAENFRRQDDKSIDERQSNHQMIG